MPLRHPEEVQKTYNAARTVCVLCAAGIGDAIMATPLLAGIKRSKPEARLIVIATESTTPVFKNNPCVDRVLGYSSEQRPLPALLRLWVELRQEKIDLFFAAQPSNTIRRSLIAACSGAKLRLKHSYDYTEFPERDFSFVYNTLLPNQMERHRVELNLDFLRFLGEDIPECSIYPSFQIDDITRTKIETLVRSQIDEYSAKRLIAIHPSVLRENKIWPIERFSEITHTLVKRKATICLVGGKDEAKLCSTIVSTINSPSVLNFAGKFTLEETAALLTHCQFLLSNDTGIMHLATAVGTKVVAIFGPTDFKHIGPFSRDAKIIFKSKSISDVQVSDVLQIILQECNARFKLEGLFDQHNGALSYGDVEWRA